MAAEKKRKLAMQEEEEETVMVGTGGRCGEFEVDDCFYSDAQKYWEVSRPIDI